MAEPWQLLSLAALLVLLEAAAQRRTGLHLADEGYLWYGSLRVAEGQRPMEDFRSYDPGRYYWCSVWVRVFGQGILPIRAAASVFLALGLWAGLTVAGRVTNSWIELALIGALLVVWAHPRWKRFDHALALCSVLAVVWIVEGPSVGVLFVTGVFAGIAAYFGRNHGLYFVVAQGAALLYAWIKLDDAPTVWIVGAWITGGLLGYSPMIVSWARHRGALGFYVREKLFVFVRRGSTNLTLPTPWPWRFRRGALSLPLAVSELVRRVLLFAAPLALMAGGGWIVLTAGVDQPSWLVAVIIVGGCYIHHAFGRADLPHMCQAFIPLVLGVGVAVAELPLGLGAGVAWAATFIVSLLVVCPVMPRCQRSFSGVPYDRIDVAGERLILAAPQARVISALQAYVASTMNPSDSIFLAPYLTAMYAVLGRTSPVHNTYLIFPETDEKQRRMIDDLEQANVTLAVVERSSPDDRRDLRFDATHPQVWGYLVERFGRVDVAGLGEGYDVFTRRAAAE